MTIAATVSVLISVTTRHCLLEGLQKTQAGGIAGLAGSTGPEGGLAEPLAGANEARFDSKADEVELKVPLNEES